MLISKDWLKPNAAVAHPRMPSNPSAGGMVYFESYDSRL